MKIKFKLWAPEEYRNLTPEAKSEIVNGCGPGGWKYDLIPDTMWGLDVTKACNIHDYMYHVGVTEKDKVFADEVFYANLKRIIIAKSRFWPLKMLRLRRARTYYVFVRDFGDAAFWD